MLKKPSLKKLAILNKLHHLHTHHHMVQLEKHLQAMNSTRQMLLL